MFWHHRKHVLQIGCFQESSKFQYPHWEVTSSVAHEAGRWEESLRIYFWFISKAWWHFIAPKFGALGVWEEKKLPSSTIQNQHFVDGWLILWIIILESKEYILGSSAHLLQLQSIRADWALQRHCYQNNGSGRWVSLANGMHRGHTGTKQRRWSGASLACWSSRAVVLQVGFSDRSAGTRWELLTQAHPPSPPRSTQSGSLGMGPGDCRNVLSRWLFCTFKLENHCPWQCSVRKLIKPASTEMFWTSPFTFQEGCNQEETKTLGRLLGCEGQWEIWAPLWPWACSHHCWAHPTGSLRAHLSLPN